MFQPFIYEIFVSTWLGSMSLPNLLVVCLCSSVMKKVFIGYTCISWLWLIYPCSMGEPQGLTGPPYVYLGLLDK